MKGPATRPCESCPYRRDVPAGVWDVSEYEKLLSYDHDTASQPLSLFRCHQYAENDDTARLCAGWVGCHGDQLLSLRIAVIKGRIDPDVFDYQSPVPLFESGSAAAAHGVSGITTPGEDAVRVMAKIVRKRPEVARGSASPSR